MTSVNAPRDANFVPTALFEIDGSNREVMPGQIDEATGRILVDNAGGGGVGTWVAVTGAIDGVNPTFTLPSIPGSDFMLVLGGQVQIKTKWYTVSGLTITYQAGYIPIGIPTDEHKAFIIS